jgi:hypothetical protein
MLFPFGPGRNFAETGDSTNDVRFLAGCADRQTLGGDQELSSFIRMTPVTKVSPVAYSNEASEAYSNEASEKERSGDHGSVVQQPCRGLFEIG